MVEKALLLACVALLAIAGISQVGSALSKLFTQTECAVSGKVICIINDPNAPDMGVGK